MRGLAFDNDDRVAIELSDHVAHVRLMRSDKMNALDPAMFTRIIAAGEALRDAKGVRAVVLSGEGRAFCAGLDVSSFGASADPDAPPLTERTHGNANKFQQVAMIWRKCPAPVIAAVHGVCFGGGLQIASGADIRIAHPATRMAVMEMKWGLVPDMGGFALWRGNVRDDVLRELTYTAREFTAEDGARMGFVTSIADDPLAAAHDLARAIATRNPDAVRQAKWLANSTIDMDEDAILLAEAEAQSRVIRTPNQIEAVMAEMGKRAADYAD